MQRENQEVSVCQYLEKSEERRKRKAAREAAIKAAAEEIKALIVAEELNKHGGRRWGLKK